MPHFANRYERSRELGRGGYGVVWLATDHHLERSVALKLFGRNQNVFAYREAQFLTALESPHVLRVFNADSYQDIPYMATEVAPLGSAEDRIGANPGVPADVAIRWIRHLLVGLGLCHR